MKIFPMIFLGLLLARRRFAPAAVAVAVCGLTTIISLWLVCPDIALAWRGTRQGVELFREMYILHFTHLEADHSLFGLTKAIVRFVLPPGQGAVLAVFHVPLPPAAPLLVSMVAAYLPLMAVVGIVLYFTRIIRLPLVNQVICLTVASILLPPLSSDYTLLYLYAPWALLVLAVVEGGDLAVPGGTAALLCFAVLFSPETEFIFQGRSYGGQIKAVTLLVLMVIALRYRFPSSYDEAQAGGLPA